MLSEEALAEREWDGLAFLCSVLERPRRDFDARLYPTSISDSEFDHLRRIVYLAALVSDRRDDVLAAVAAGTDARARASRLDAALRDLHQLRSGIAAYVHLLSDSVRRLEALGHELTTAAERGAPS